MKHCLLLIAFSCTPALGGEYPNELVTSASSGEDCNHNGIDDSEDIAQCDGDSSCSDCNGDGRPDVCGTVIDCDIVETPEFFVAGPEVDRHFGRSVSLTNDLAIVGARWDPCEGQDEIRCGAAYIFRFDGSTWSEEQKLTASDGDRFDRFGASVSVFEDTAMVGAVKADCFMAGQCGAVYVFRFIDGRWVETQKLVASDGRPADFFGGSISRSGDTVAIGAVFDDRPDCWNCGSAYVFISMATRG